MAQSLKVVDQVEGVDQLGANGISSGKQRKWGADFGLGSTLWALKRERESSSVKSV